LRDPIVWPEVIEDDAVYVYNLAVSRRWAGQGLGYRMLGWAEDQVKRLGRTYLRLDHFAHNEFLRRYYQDVGFIDRGEIMAEYPSPVGTLRLRRYEKPV
jgi:ribosomal protein S18 acetylase RimI-like enzyme